MTPVFLVLAPDYGGTEVVGVYRTREEAERHVATCEWALYVEEHPLRDRYEEA